MANHGYIALEKPITTKMLHDALVEISKERFDGLIKIEAIEDAPDGWGHGTNFIHVFKTAGHPIWLRKPNILEIRHDVATQIGWWIESVFINDLAVKFRGVITDDGHGDEMRGEPGKDPTLEERVRRLFSILPDGKPHPHLRFIVAQALWEARAFRPDLKKWLRKRK